eukprot:SM007100S21251  [mRNA]  locus=s7100:255:669:- [translate_table: standard]
MAPQHGCSGVLATNEVPSLTRSYSSARVSWPWCRTGMPWWCCGANRKTAMKGRGPSHGARGRSAVGGTKGGMTMSRSGR